MLKLTRGQPFIDILNNIISIQIIEVLQYINLYCNNNFK